MKRVTLLADRIEGPIGTTRRVYLPGDGQTLYIHSRHVLAVEDACACDFAPPAPPAPPAAGDRLTAAAPPAAGDRLTAAEIDALPIGAVIDATVTGVRARAMLTDAHVWVMLACLDGSRVVAARDLKDPTLVTDAPISSAPLLLPTEPGERFWGQTSAHAPQWWFVQSDGSDDHWYLPARGMAVWPHEVAGCGLVRLPDPSASDATA